MIDFKDEIDFCNYNFAIHILLKLHFENISTSINFKAC